QTFFPKRASNARSTKLLYPSIKELNKLEAEMLKQLEYRLHLRGSLEHFIQLLNKLIATKNMFYELGWKELQKYARSSQKKMLTFKQYEAWCQITYKSLKELTSDPHEENVESPSSTRWSKHHTFKHDVSDITHKIKKVQL
ncbi:MAG TPA: hypothetical protein VFP93_02710, partial [Gammaproteobacteria bacterium]|nr:hypothetical protein [Gammaproteobacteria bacterium]